MKTKNWKKRIKCHSSQALIKILQEDFFSILKNKRLHTCWLIQRYTLTPIVRSSDVLKYEWQIIYFISINCYWFFSLEIFEIYLDESSHSQCHRIKFQYWILYCVERTCLGLDFICSTLIENVAIQLQFKCESERYPAKDQYGSKKRLRSDRTIRTD